MKIIELAQRYAEKPTDARYEALAEEIFKQESTAKGIIWYNALEGVLPRFCDNYRCEDCPIGHDVCDRASTGQTELENALKKTLSDMGYATEGYYSYPSREETLELIKRLKSESEE